MSINNPAYLRLSTVSVPDFFTHSPVSTAHAYPVHLPPGCAPSPRRLRVPLLLVPPIRFNRNVARFHGPPLSQQCLFTTPRPALSLHPPLRSHPPSTPPHMSRAQRTHTIKRTSNAAPLRRPTLHPPLRMLFPSAFVPRIIHMRYPLRIHLERRSGCSAATAPGKLICRALRTPVQHSPLAPSTSYTHCRFSCVTRSFGVPVYALTSTYI